MRNSRQELIRKTSGPRAWTIPTFYTAISLAAAVLLPRAEHYFLPTYTHAMSAAVAVAFLSAAASGILAFTAIVFSVAFVMVQFSAIAYSPRLALWFGGSHELHHALGVFIATFTYAMATLLWTDRGGAGAVPLFSILLVLALLIASMLVFSRLVRNLGKLQIAEVLVLVGDKGRDVIRDQERMFDNSAVQLATETTGIDRSAAAQLQPTAHKGSPTCVQYIDYFRLVRVAQNANGVVELMTAVGDTLIDGDIVFRSSPSLADNLLRCICTGRERTFEQDPKYAIRILVDIAIKALSPAINDPTTAVQALDQIDDLLRRLNELQLGNLWLKDQTGAPRVFVPMPSWGDYLSLAFDEIRQCGLMSIQVMRRLHAALAVLVEKTPDRMRQRAAQEYLIHLDAMIQNSTFDAQDRAIASEPDPQGLGLPRRERQPTFAPIPTSEGIARSTRGKRSFHEES